MRRWMQRLLAAIWFFDGILQFRPLMLGPGFVQQVVLPLAAGEPVWLRRLVLWDAHTLMGHVILADVSVGLVQIGLGVWLWRKRPSRWAFFASFAWSMSVWVMGEAFGQIFTGTSWLGNGAPGAALLYAILSLGLLPSWRRSRRLSYFRLAAASLWAFEGVLWLLPVAHVGMGHVIGIAHVGRFAGLAVSVMIVALLLSQRGMAWGSLLGTGMSLLVWIFGEHLGQFWQPYATDINSGLLLAMISVVPLLNQRPSRVRREERAQGDAGEPQRVG